MSTPFELPSQPTHEELTSHVIQGVKGDINTIAIIGSYTVSGIARPGSDIDIIVAVQDLEATSVGFDEVVYKRVDIKDSMGERSEVNTILGQTVLDVTVIDRFNTPNSPLTDGYENAIGSCYNSLTVFGTPLKDLFGLDKVIEDYEKIRGSRLAVLDAKIGSTKQKIQEQDRRDLHILYELQKYVFIRECIGRNIFNQLSIKHPKESIPDFEDIFVAELAECGLALAITNTRND